MKMIETDTRKNDHTGAKKRSSILDARYLYIILISVALIALLDASNLDTKVLSEKFYLPLHIAMEASSLVVCLAVFATGWYGYKQTRNKRDLLISTTFFATGMIDFVHVLSYKGMPDFLAINRPGTASAYWMAARLVVGIGLLAAALISPRSKSKFLSPAWLLAACAVIITATCVIITVYAKSVNSLLWTPGPHPLTPVKVWTEYLVILIYLGAFFSFSERRNWDAAVVRPLRSALLLAIFAELSLTLYVTPFSLMNALGHIFKTAAYYMILNALFVSALQKPYEELSRANDELNDLYYDAQNHRKEIEKSFANIGSALSSSIRLDEALNLIAKLAADMLHADFAIVASADKHLELVHVASSGSRCHEEDRPLDLARIFGKRAMSERRSIIENSLRSTGMTNCDFTRPDCLRSMACAPTIYEGSVLGLITIYSHEENAFVESDIKLLEGFAAHAAVAISNAMNYERESHIADVLQKSFLSSARVATDRFEIAQVYQPAMDEARVGGDFYDIIEIDENRIGLVIGDVSGKGLASAVHTAMAKYTLRAYLGEGHSAAEAIRLLDKAVGRYSAMETFITLFLGILDINTGELIYVNAGHEPAVYSRNGTFLTLQSTGPALGLGISDKYFEGKSIIEPGGILVLYTDGISEARRGMDFLGTERIGDLLAVCDQKRCEDVARCVYESALEFAGGELRDDAAILAVKAIN